MPTARSAKQEGVVDNPVLGYRGPQVCSIVGITYRQLDYWARTGLLHPSISQARGSGSQRLYSYSDLLQLKVIKRLLDSGVSLQAARRAIDCLRSSGEDLGSANLVIDDRRSVLAHTGEEIIDLLKGGQTVLNIVPLGGLVTELESAITELGLPGRPGPVAAPAGAGDDTESAAAGSPPGLSEAL
ncbi:MAG TPA: MerR family transcriptional regulator [Acidimicrobiales bacterium]|nr:MerR family transcriptional regulator [Acidimicrobiales bacterium]